MDYEVNDGFGVMPEPDKIIDAQPAGAPEAQEPVAEAAPTEPGAGMPAAQEPADPTLVQPAISEPADPTLVQPAGFAARQGGAAGQMVQQQAPMPAGSTLVRPQPAPPATGYVPPAASQPGYQGGYTVPDPTAVSAVRTTTVGRGRSLLWGIIGGAIGAAALVGALFLAGVLGQGSDGSAPLPVNGQPITINPSDEVGTAKAVAAKTLPSVVSIYCTYTNGSGMGSGVIFDTQGNIITNNHVIEGARTISVTIDGVSYDAIVVGTDASSDLAVIRADLDGAQVTPIEVGDSSSLAPGDWVMTVGSPFGLESSVSSGIVSSLYRSSLMTSASGNTLYTNLIQVDAAINPGNSGGALVNARGQLVGICTLFSSDTQSFAGIGFAIPGNYAVEIAQMIINGEQVTHAYIGLSMMTVTEQTAAANNLSVNAGAYVAEVAEDGPAEAAGIEVGDIVVNIAGEKIESADDVLLAIRSHRIGETVTVTVMRGDERMTFDVTLGSDERLQELQAQQREQQQKEQEQQQDFWNRDNGTGDGDGSGDGDGTTYEEIFERWLEELFGDGSGQENGWDWNQIYTPENNDRP